MENATKALLIAASVLIVILLIAFGMKIFNSTSGTADNIEITMSATEKATFNSKFTQHHGSNKSAATVRAVADKVIAHNATNSQKVSFKVGTEAATNSANTIMSYVSNLSGIYTISVTIDDTTGLVTLITVSE